MQKHAMSEFMIRTRQRRWVVSSLLGLTLCGLASGCKPAVDPQPDNIAAPKTVTIPQTPKVEDIAVDRAQLLRALADAASAAAIGEVDSSVEASLTGRQFILKMPIGCEGESDAATGWIYDSESQRLTLKATPDIALDDVIRAQALPAVNAADTKSVQKPADIKSADASNAGAQAQPLPRATSSSATSAAALPVVEAVDGFWIKHPWILSDRCPVAGQDNADNVSDQTPEGDGIQFDETAAIPQFGIAQFYTGKDPRTGRRGGQPYRIAKKIGDMERPDPQSLRLVLRGRLSAVPGQALIRCDSGKPDMPPRCIISASFDRVSFENADGSVVYGQWGGR